MEMFFSLILVLVIIGSIEMIAFLEKNSDKGDECTKIKYLDNWLEAKNELLSIVEFLIVKEVEIQRLLVCKRSPQLISGKNKYFVFFTFNCKNLCSNYFI